MQYRLIEQRYEMYRGFVQKQSLTGQPDLDELVNPFRCEPRNHDLMHGNSVIWRLHQARHGRGLKVCDPGRRRFQPHVRGEVKAIALPPSCLLTIARERQQSIALSLIGYAIKVT
jgi:hypothetical protein